MHRTFDQDTFSNFGDNSTYAGPFNDAWSQSFPQQNHPISASNLDVDYDADQIISAAYAMVDLPIFKDVNLIGGARAVLCAANRPGDQRQPEPTLRGGKPAGEIANIVSEEIGPGVPQAEMPAEAAGEGFGALLAHDQPAHRQRGVIGEPT